MRHGLLSLLALAVFLAACGPLPRPFQPEDKALDLKAMASPPAVLVLPLRQDAPGAPQEAAERLAEALSSLEVDAVAKGRVAEFVLSGAAVVKQLPRGRESVAIAWTLSEPEGQEVGGYDQRSELPAGLWQAGQAGAIAAVMSEAAPAIATLTRQAKAAADRAATAAVATSDDAAGAVPNEANSADWHLVVLPPDSAPGDGSDSLPQALEAELRAAAIPLADEAGDNDLVVKSDVDLGPAVNGWQDIRIAWVLVRASDGTDLGQIEQENRVPAGSLDGSWGPTAQAIARGAAGGLVDLLSHLGRS